MSGFLSGFFARRAAKPSGNAPQANPAAQFDILLSQYNSSYQALGEPQLNILFLTPSQKTYAIANIALLSLFRDPASAAH